MPDFLDFSSAFSGGVAIEMILFVAIIAISGFLLYAYIYFSGSKWILRWYGAQKAQKSEKPVLHSLLKGLSSRAEVNPPEVYIFESKIPSMFTVGHIGKSSIAISTSMLEIFGALELETLMAHEIGHIKNRDVGKNTFIAFLAGTIMLFPNFAMWCSMLMGFGQPEDPAPRFFRYTGSAIAAPPAALLIHLTNPAKRELEADEVAVELTKNPHILAKTIEYLENYIPLQPVSTRFNPGHFHLFSTHTQQVRGYLSIFISMFDTHPESQDRITRILSHSTYSKNEALSNKRSRVPGFFDVKNWKLALGISFVSYMAFLFVIIVGVTFALKDFNFLVNGGIAAVYTGAVVILIGATAKLSRRKTYFKSPLVIHKRIILNSVQVFKHLMKRE
ncbi:M48 family metalloprotease [Methanosarcina mazei]|jgi:Zn-dependent protease with chaperone function|uniref:Protease HTPX-like protein n=1 Tax=Methanosarcina mazei TaxID=2209 RepID=A0A0F8NX02_METMZ|nr:M48 family metalloprotease [Methanosarcina mazei]KKG02333.1 protease HTPX-like protein [Methanosarcina mazei]KKG05237.1 protease HTPX-like protein [Methanosarcina mazei]KKG51290.1 protease HTPX-like protein [Methanosarcina mazei]KKG59637.1 protease HTPX-like protein [Methanosarcina mazei]KKG61833.1 protease HTPX-like protein [Methanosarcina mazei]